MNALCLFFRWQLSATQFNICRGEQLTVNRLDMKFDTFAILLIIVGIASIDASTHNMTWGDVGNTRMVHEEEVKFAAGLRPIRYSVRYRSVSENVS